METVPEGFFSIATFSTLAGATGIVLVVTNGLRQAFGADPRWLGLVVSQVVMITGVLLLDGGAKEYLMAVLNGFLVFSTASGAATITSPHSKQDGNSKLMGMMHSKAHTKESKGTFFRSWF